jgi:Flp pilus assembly protein TadD
MGVDLEREARKALLQAVLIESGDPGVRARAHLDLGRLLMAEGRVEQAVRHLREALLLDRRLLAARTLLSELGEGSALHTAGEGKRGIARALLGRLRGR